MTINEVDLLKTVLQSNTAATPTDELFLTYVIQKEL